VIKLPDTIGNGVEDIEPVIGADPYASLFIFHECGDGAVGKRGLTENAILDKNAAIVAVKAAIGADPENPGFVL
jgi:hypothetical protein